MSNPDEPGAGPPRAHGQTGVVLMAIEAWRNAGEGETPPILYGIVRSAFEMGLAARSTPGTLGASPEGPRMNHDCKTQRAVVANDLIHAIAAHGRGFFAHDGRVSYFDVDARGRVWFVDSYTRRRVYTHYEGRWRYFTQGGTLRQLVIHLRDFIRTGTPIPAVLGPWPARYCGGDLWGYGAEMEAVRTEAHRLGLLTSKPEASDV